MTDPATLRAFAEDRLRQLRSRAAYYQTPIASPPTCERCGLTSRRAVCRRCTKEEK